MLAFENITKKYGKDVVLDSVDMVLGPGEFAFLTGPSGAGKSTLLRLILKEGNEKKALEYLRENIERIKKRKVPKEDLIIIRSTVNPGTCDKLEKLGKNICYMPEYLGESTNHPLLDETARKFLIQGDQPY